MEVQGSRPKRKFPWLKVLVHLLGVTPLVSILVAALTGVLSVNPIQDIEQRLGRAGLYFLVASLAVTPLVTLTGWSILSRRRRALGLYAFLYISLHFAIFSGVDYGFDFVEIIRLIAEKPFILLGFTTGLLLSLLALTSNDFIVRKMRKRWKSLHRLVYFAVPAVIIHYAWARKGDLFTLQGDIIKPLLWGLLVIFLLVLRIPPLRRRVVALRRGLQDRLATRGKTLEDGSP